MLNIEPLNQDYDEQAVLCAVDESLTAFYSALNRKLDTIDIKAILKSKNPYLYRAKGINSAAQIVSSILAAFVSSSEETSFGNQFFEPIAIAVSGGQKAMTEGADITVDKDNTIYTIAVKSGTSVFNADSRKRQEENFKSAQKRAQQARKAFIPVVGYGYGNKKFKAQRFYCELAGQDFWHWLTGDADFYMKIIDYMGDRPEHYAEEFKEAYERAENRLLRAFVLDYCHEDGSVDWDALIKYNSGC